MAQVSNHGIIVGSLRGGAPDYTHHDGDFRVPPGWAEHQVLRTEYPNRLVLLGDNQEGGACRHHQCRGLCQGLIVLDELHRSCHDRPDFDVVRFESLSNDFLHNVCRRHKAEPRIGILHEQAGRLFPFEQQSRLTHGDVSWNLHNPWCHHMGNHSVCEICRLEGLVIVVWHGFEPFPPLSAYTTREDPIPGDVSQV